MPSYTVYRPVHLRRNVGFWTVITVPTVLTPYSTVQITVGQNYGVRPYKDGAPYSTIFVWAVTASGLKFTFYSRTYMCVYVSVCVCVVCIFVCVCVCRYVLLCAQRA